MNAADIFAENQSILAAAKKEAAHPNASANALTYGLNENSKKDTRLSLAQARAGRFEIKGDLRLQPHRGKVAMVTGAAGGIGRATAQRLHEDGALVLGLDINPKVTEVLSAPGLSGLVCDITDETALQNCVDQAVDLYGGLDIIVANAGIFKTGEYIEDLGKSWDLHLAINLTATQRFMRFAIPYLKVGIESSIIVVGSRNFAAPGPGAAAYSVSKAGVTQLARVAALELAPFGVRVNTIHPDAVFDTELWTQEALERSASRYGMTVDAYKKRNLLRREIKSTDIAALISTLAGPVFAATTGAQIPIDGGNDRVI